MADKILLTKTTLAAKLGISEHTVDRVREEDPTFPKPIQLRDGGRLHWFDDEAEIWIEAQRAKRDGVPVEAVA